MDLSDEELSIEAKETVRNFTHSYRDGNFSDVKYLLTHKTLSKHIPQDKRNMAATKALQFSNMEAFDFLLTSPLIKPHADIRHNRADLLRSACEKGKIDFVKKLMELSKSKKNNKTKYTFDEQKDAFLEACQNGNLHIVRYLMEECDFLSPGIKALQNINDGFIRSCTYNQFEIVKYLLESPQLKVKANLYAYNSRALEIAFLNNHESLINYFLYDKKMRVRADFIEGFFFLTNNKEMIEKIKGSIEKRDLLMKLNELPEQSFTLHKAKL